MPSLEGASHTLSSTIVHLEALNIYPPRKLGQSGTVIEYYIQYLEQAMRTEQESPPDLFPRVRVKSLRKTLSKFVNMLVMKSSENTTQKVRKGEWNMSQGFPPSHCSSYFDVTNSLVRYARHS